MGNVKSQALVKWFDRKFDSNISGDRYDDILKRLTYFPLILNLLLDGCPNAIATVKKEGKWSVHENVGHLILLEKLWRSRFQDIKGGKQNMSTTDLNNTATDRANFNKSALGELAKSLAHERTCTIKMLEKMTEEDFLKLSMHPRLNRPMSIVELMYFVAEHDAHHLQAIALIIATTEIK